jgi:ATP-dependent RNA helicase DDX60
MLSFDLLCLSIVQLTFNISSSLFRQGFVRVVIATGTLFDKCYCSVYLTSHTGTLALGINAPAKTSAFCGDSPFLTALMVCQ